MLADHETLPIQLLMNAFLINTGEKLIYVDKSDPESSGSPRRYRSLGQRRQRRQIICRNKCDNAVPA